MCAQAALFLPSATQPHRVHTQHLPASQRRHTQRQLSPDAVHCEGATPPLHLWTGRSWSRPSRAHASPRLWRMELWRELRGLGQPRHPQLWHRHADVQGISPPGCHKDPRPVFPPPPSPRLSPWLLGSPRGVFGGFPSDPSYNARVPCACHHCANPLPLPLLLPRRSCRPTCPSHVRISCGGYGGASAFPLVAPLFQRRRVGDCLVGIAGLPRAIPLIPATPMRCIRMCGSLCPFRHGRRRRDERRRRAGGLV